MLSAVSPEEGTCARITCFVLTRRSPSDHRLSVLHARRPQHRSSPAHTQHTGQRRRLPTRMAAELVCLTKTVKASSTDRCFVLWVPCPPHSAHLRGTGWAILAEVARCLAHFGCEMCFSFHHLPLTFSFYHSSLLPPTPKLFFFLKQYRKTKTFPQNLSISEISIRTRGSNTRGSNCTSTRNRAILTRCIT